MNKLENLQMQRAGLIATLIGVLKAPCSEPEATALKMATLDTIIMVVSEYSVGDDCEMELMSACLEFTNDGLTQAHIMNDLKAILGGE